MDYSKIDPKEFQRGRIAAQLAKLACKGTAFF